jgi:hypothetical protein
MLKAFPGPFRSTLLYGIGFRGLPLGSTNLYLNLCLALEDPLLPIPLELWWARSQAQRREQRNPLKEIAGTRTPDLYCVKSDKCQMEEWTKLKARRKAQEGR